MNKDELRNEILKKTAEYYRLAHAPQHPFEPGISRVGYAGRVFDEAEIVNLVGASLDFWLSFGPYSEEFEAKLADYLGLKYCLMVNSGSSANLLAFMTLTSDTLGERRVGRGDEVITVAAGFPTTVAPIVQYGAVPVFVDIELMTVNVDVDRLKTALSPRTKAVFLAHTLGNPFDGAAIRGFCDRHGLWLIEDNCDALGSRLDGRLTGTFGHISTSSFYPSHHITTGEGGAVYTNDARLHKIALSLRDWGRDCWCVSGRDSTCGHRFDRRFGELPVGYDHKYVYSHFGYNLKATDMQAAVGLAQLDKLPDFVEARRRHWQRLHDGLADLSDCLTLPTPASRSEPSWFGFLMMVREISGLTRADFVNYLEARNIQTRMLFAGNLLRHPCFDAMRRTGEGYRVEGGLENTDVVTETAFWVGVYPGMTDGMLDYMVKALHEAAEEAQGKR